MPRKPLISPGSILPPAEAAPPPDDLLSRVIAGDRARHRPTLEASETDATGDESANNREIRIAGNIPIQQLNTIDSEQSSNYESQQSNKVANDDSKNLANIIASNSETGRNAASVRYNVTNREAAMMPPGEEPLVQVNARVPASLARGIKILSVKRGQSTQSLVAEILAQYLEEVGEL